MQKLRSKRFLKKKKLKKYKANFEVKQPASRNFLIGLLADYISIKINKSNSILEL
jgi:hypothetical protein